MLECRCAKLMSRGKTKDYFTKNVVLCNVENLDVL